ncbi:MAG: UDP-N-acetylmuramate--L-alanine ligase [Bacteroidetes bacterium]|nr:UDP-N-acetylmuramate--L-alanine ligase [Bacteroidota bacterium]
MKLAEKNIIYFIGIGGIGMSALARHFKAQGKIVSGYDKTETKLTKQLVEEGIAVHYDDTIEALPAEVKANQSDVLVVYTPAIPAAHIGKNYLLEQGVTLYKRSEVLGELTKLLYNVSVSGTHGKTTISSMVAHLFKVADLSFSAFLGGVSKNLNSNYLGNKDAEICVVEADEYDRSFLRLYPDIMVCSSVDPDHLDIYGTGDKVVESFQLFAKNIKKNGQLLVNYKVASTFEEPYLTYSLDNPEADYYAKNIRVEDGFYCFDIVAKGKVIEGASLGLPGLHNVENCIAASAVAFEMNVTAKVILKALKEYKGVDRRFEVVLRKNNMVYVDDYAHHPEELNRCITSMRHFFPGKKITGVFQPHLFSRTRDFADGFARSLELLDEVILLEIYPARELPMPGINSQFLLDKIQSANKKLLSKEEVKNRIKNLPLEVLLTVGAGDIGAMVGDIKHILEEKQ